MSSSPDRLAATRSVPEHVREIAESIVDTSTIEGQLLLAVADQYERMREALEWYSERRNYLPAGGEHHYDALVARDAYDSGGPGARARSALGVSTRSSSADSCSPTWKARLVLPREEAHAAQVRVKVADLPEFKAFLERVRDFINEYAWHDRTCAAIDAAGEWHRGNPACTCGYDDGLAKLTEGMVPRG